MIIDQGIIAGNICNKYETKNPLIRLATNRFLSCAKGLIESHKEQITSVTETGCGEGHLSARISSWGDYTIRACDVSALIIDKARQENKNLPVTFYQRSIYDIDANDAADLMVCCEVLEHLEHPEQALEALARTTRRYCLLSVPHEPWWRAVNMIRGKYLREFGNTPGHCQHWGKTSFILLIRNYFDIIAVRAPFPWLMVLAAKKPSPSSDDPSGAK